MAIQYKNMHQLDKAYNYYRIAEEMYLSNPLTIDSRLGDVYTNIGNYFQIKGDHSEAIRYQERAFSIYQNQKKLTDNEKNNSLKVIYNLANAYYLSLRENDALKIVIEHLNEGSFSHYVNFKNLMANIYDTFRDYKKSKKGLFNL